MTITSDAVGNRIVETAGYAGGFVKTPVAVLEDGRLSSHAKLMYLLLVNATNVQNDAKVLFPDERFKAALSISSSKTLRVHRQMLRDADLIGVHPEDREMVDEYTGQVTKERRYWYTVTEFEDAPLRNTSRLHNFITVSVSTKKTNYK